MDQLCQGLESLWTPARSDVPQGFRLAHLGCQILCGWRPAAWDSRPQLVERCRGTVGEDSVVAAKAPVPVGSTQDSQGVALEVKDERGVPIRFGLANTSKAVNGELKSGDLIGIRPVLITPDMVGKVIGQFVSRECKESHWKYNPRDTRDVAQGRWAALVNSLGGDAKVTVGEL